MTSKTRFSAGIIAAGEGSRLRSSFPNVLKPLVPVAGRPLIEWTVSSLVSAGADEILVLLNSKGRPVRDHLRTRFPSTRWIFLEADTRSSWESFRIVAGALAERAERFLISTVDALAMPEDVARFASEARGCALALTDFVDDEKPLWAELGADGHVRALGPDAKERRYVTCGLYALTRSEARTFEAAEAYASLRDYWVSLARSGVNIRGIPLSKTVDVDRPEDVASAEAFLGALESRSC